jgi:multidrug efflux pump subunit AcrA (membrane-fusion protein)
MKHIFLTIIVAAALSGCGKQSTTNDPESTAKATEADGEGAGEAIQLNEGLGLFLHPKLRKAIALEIVEVEEEQVEPEFTVNLHVIQGADTGFQKISLTAEAGVEANGWLSAEKASRIQPGQKVLLRKDSPTSEVLESGVVKRIEKSPYAMLGDFEIVVETATPFDTGTRLIATIQAPAGEAGPVVPRSALLKTAEGFFVYTINDDSFLRTPVTVGAMNDNLVEITDGLYTGDQVVSSPVNSLWMAELQLLRGGKSCTCGH